MVPLPSVIHTAAPDHGKLLTLVAGKRRRLFSREMMTKCLWQEPSVRSPVPNFTFIWATCPIFGPLSKNNTGMAALCAGLPVKIDNVILQKVDCTKYLGVFIDSSLSWENHIDYIYNKIIKFVGIFYKIRYKLILISRKWSAVHLYIHIWFMVLKSTEIHVRNI